MRVLCQMYFLLIIQISSKNKTIISNYTFNDITEWIWPRYPTNTSSWVAQYPQFLLNNKYEIKVGSNIADVYSFPAFYQSQGSKFVSNL